MGGEGRIRVHGYALIQFTRGLTRMSTVLLGRNPLDKKGYAKATLFLTHTDAGSNRVVHKQQFRTASAFIKYYNKKYIGPHDLAVTSLLAGDFNISPLKYHNNGTSHTQTTLTRLQRKTGRGPGMGNK